MLLELSGSLLCVDCSTIVLPYKDCSPANLIYTIDLILLSSSDNEPQSSIRQEKKLRSDYITNRKGNTECLLSQQYSVSISVYYSLSPKC